MTKKLDKSSKSLTGNVNASSAAAGLDVASVASSVNAPTPVDQVENVSDLERPDVLVC